MNIIVEGVDASGKDSFINNLAQLTGRNVVRGSSFEISEGGADEMYRKTKEILADDDYTIINRFFYSNMVYGELFNYPMMSDEQYQELNDIVSEEAIVYYLEADTEIIQERLKNRGDDKIKPEDIKKIQDAYEVVWEKCHPKTFVRIDTSDNQLLDINSPIYETVVTHCAEMDYIRSGFKEEN